MSYYVYNPAYLAHHGILGQKWGVRRYQNEDGSLTDAGRKRYSKDNFKQYKREVLNNKTGNTTALKSFYNSDANKALKIRAIAQMEKQRMGEDEWYKADRERDIAELKSSKNSKAFKNADAKRNRVDKKLDKIYEESANLSDEIYAAADSFAKSFLGEYGSKKISGLNVPGTRRTATQLLINEIKNDIVRSPVAPDYDLYKR